MTLDIVLSRIRKYQSKTKLEELNAFKEICQEIALCGLARSNFFNKGAFQGGTCLRILYGLRRFSEDLDFILLNPDANFTWRQYLNSIEEEFASFGLSLEVLDRSQVQGIIKRAFLKENSFAKVLELKSDLLPSDKQIIKIKLEIDINPPEGSFYERQFLDYPYPFSVLCQDGQSLFASKCHSLICRPYIKGRDWFDFIWFISQKMQINYKLLSNALFQSGPFKEKEISVDKNWIIQTLNKKIEEIDWQAVRLDVESFLKQEDKKHVENWNKDLFFGMTKKLGLFLN